MFLMFVWRCYNWIIRSVMCKTFEPCNINNFTSGVWVNNNSENIKLWDYTNLNTSIKKIVPDSIEEHSAEENEPVCKICMNFSVKTIITDCGHACLCVTCSRMLFNSDEFRCPLCRVQITKIERIYI